MAPSLDYFRVRRSSQEYQATGGLVLRDKPWSCASVISHLAVLLVGTVVGASVRKLVVDTCPALTRFVSTPVPKSVFAPRLPTVMTPDERFVGWSDTVNNNWLAILEGKFFPRHIYLPVRMMLSLKNTIPGSDDGVWIPDAEGYGLGQGFQGPSDRNPRGNMTNRFYHISNQHQLHCLVR